ncbi:MAG TPA: hypothetical protein VLS90_21195 [Thermodesulfobacteriota bacterium]|nr:hypothetical protein [Thermodesulfobacteriota bacterium]
MDPFHLKLLLAFGVGSVMITATTVLTETAGSKVGGLTGGIPSMVSITLLFIGIVEDPRAASEATTFIPQVMGINGLFLVVYAFLTRWGGWVALAGAFASWALLSSVVFFARIENFLFSVLMCVFCLVFSYSMLDRKLRVRSGGRLPHRYTPAEIAFRALFSGSIVVSAVYFSKIGGPVWGGILAPFPTVYLSSLTIMQRSNGVEHALALTKPLLVSSLVNVLAYSIAVRYFYLHFSLAAGTILALAVSGCSAYAAYRFIKERMT